MSKRKSQVEVGAVGDIESAWLPHVAALRAIPYDKAAGWLSTDDYATKAGCSPKTATVYLIKMWRRGALQRDSSIVNERRVYIYRPVELINK